MPVPLKLKADLHINLSKHLFQHQTKRGPPILLVAQAMEIFDHLLGTVQGCKPNPIKSIRMSTCRDIRTNSVPVEGLCTKFVLLHIETPPFHITTHLLQHPALSAC